MAVSRDALLNILKDAYTVYFDDVSSSCSAPFLAASYAFHSRNEGYMLSKKAKLWSAETHEYVYVFSVPELNADVYEDCRKLACGLGMKNIRPHIEHMKSYITALFVCDGVTDGAVQALRKTRMHRNFLFSLYGWMDLRTAAVDLASGSITVNRAGSELKDFIRGNLEKISLRRN
ncbi:hypothetical protein [uncultured Mailhella sp.]|uniref:hypothetical protein n=1 Tax=uncultured Mailhella sp. TaxID=1981031 RepID=UPI002603AE4E|nr:hypothetical protein [uncultured Mailhella sp.]